MDIQYLFYARNAQGDIAKIVDSSGSVVVEYSYDAWGNLKATTGSLAGTLGIDNPYRYRGYRYDVETGLYYLQSRYYNPLWGRFVNADRLVGSIGGIGSHNVFAYCGSNPVCRTDPSGLFWQEISYFLSGIFGAGVTYEEILPNKAEVKLPSEYFPV